MTDNVEEENLELFEINNINHIIKGLNDSDLISIFFLLIEFDKGFISTEQFLRIVKKDRNQMEMFLKETLFSYKNTKLLLSEILNTIKRYDLLKTLKTCRHELQQNSSLSCLDRLGKYVYESLESESGLKILEKNFPEEAFSEIDYLEIFVVEAFSKNLISKSDLIDLGRSVGNNDSLLVLPDTNNETYFIRTPTNSSPCGLAVILNHKNFYCEEDNMPNLKKRVDSHLDVDGLEKLWKSFGFETRVRQDLNDDEVLFLFEELSKEDFSNYDCFIVCYMSHGHEGVVFASNGKPVKIQQIIHLMANECQSLLNKPKLFFIQACQGDKVQYTGDSVPVLSIPCIPKSLFIKTNESTSLFEDVLVASSTIPGFVSFAADGTNSWFIQALIENLERYGHQQHILDVMTKVNNKVSKNVGKLNDGKISVKQTSCQQTSLRKTLQFKKLKKVLS